MNRMASPVDFISGPSSLLTPGNLLKLKTGSLMAKPFSFFSNVKSVSLWRADHDLGGDIEIGYLVSLGNKRGRPGRPGIGFDHEDLIVFDRELDIDQALYPEGPGDLFRISIPWS